MPSGEIIHVNSIFTGPMLYPKYSTRCVYERERERENDKDVYEGKGKVVGGEGKREREGERREGDYKEITNSSS